MKIIIINCFETSIDRVESIKKYFENSNKNNKVTVLQSDFLHMKKERRKDAKKDYIFLRTLPYKKNLSIRRVLSHMLYAKKALKEAKKIGYDLLYVIAPPNSLIKETMHKKIENTTIIFDICDLWPESMPLNINNIIFKFLLTKWSNLRNKYLKCADLVITECNLYQELLRKELEKLNTETVYLTRKSVENPLTDINCINDSTINLVYVGSINNIIDINFIIKILLEIKKYKDVMFHIIGTGENVEKLIHLLDKNNLEYKFYGPIYNDSEKREIFDKCSFGINIMKTSVKVGLTMKSLEYFKFGLPILNNIAGDTKQKVTDYNIGFNLSESNLEGEVPKIVNTSKKEILKMRENTLSLFNKEFCEEVYYEKMKKIIDPLLKDKEIDTIDKSCFFT